jgi:hypothetical protein
VGASGGQVALAWPVLSLRGSGCEPIIREVIKAPKRGTVIEFPFSRLKQMKRHFSHWCDLIDVIAGTTCLCVLRRGLGPELR